MKKKLLCLILVFVLLPTVFLFTGCKKKYDLSTLEQDYKNIYQSLKTIKLNENKFEVSFKDYEYLNQQVSNDVNGYMYLTNYNAMLKNMMAFADSYISNIAKGNFEVDKKEGENLTKQLEELKESLVKLDTNIQDTAYYVDLVKNPANQHCLIKLKNLFESYSEAFDDAFNFNSSLINIYFSNVEEKDYTTETDFMPLRAIVDVKFDARLIQQIVYTTRTFVETNIQSSSFSSLISVEGSNNFGGIASYYNSYASTIRTLRKTYTEQNVEYVNVDATKKANFKECVVKLSNIQAVLNNEVSYYINACNSVKYFDSLNNENASSEDKSHIELVKSFNNMNNNYNLVLGDMLTLLGV